MGIQTPLLGWWPSTPTHPLSNLARRHAMASSRESCQPNLWHQKSSIGTKSNKSTMGLSGTEKKTWASVFSQAPMCCKHAATQFKTATLGAFLLKKMIENASAGHIQEHGLKGTCCLAVYTGSKVAFLVFPFQVLPLIAIQIHPVHWS